MDKKNLEDVDIFELYVHMLHEMQSNETEFENCELKKLVVNNNNKNEL